MRVSVITVTFNARDTVERTLVSVFGQKEVLTEVIVIDGASTDGTLEVLRRHEDRIDILCSEPDSGIYDAMNKGVRKATGDYLLFMNSGDVFVDGSSLKKLVEHACESSESVVFGGWAVDDGMGQERLRNPDLLKGLFNHQATLYSRSIHSWHGGYANIPGLTAADYLFFRSLQASKAVSFRVCPQLVSRIDPYGISSGLQTYLQRVLVDILCGYEGRYSGALKMIVHPLYNRVKRFLVS